MELQVESMTCQHCVQAVTRAVRGIDPHAAVDVDLAGQRVRVESDASRDAIVAAIEDAGYPAR